MLLYRKAFEREKEKFREAIQVIAKYSGRKKLNRQEAEELERAQKVIEERLGRKLPPVEKEYIIVD